MSLLNSSNLEKQEKKNSMKNSPIPETKPTSCKETTKVIKSIQQRKPDFFPSRELFKQITNSSQRCFFFSFFFTNFSQFPGHVRSPCNVTKNLHNRAHGLNLICTLTVRWFLDNQPSLSRASFCVYPSENDKSRHQPTSNTFIIPSQNYVFTPVCCCCWW